MQHRFAAFVSLAGIVAIGFAGIVRAGPRLQTVTESTFFDSSSILGIPSVTTIDIAPFDTSLGILKEVDVGIAGNTKIIGSYFTGRLPIGSTYFAELSHRFSGIEDSYFEFSGPATTPPLVGPLLPVITPQMVFQEADFFYSFSFDEATEDSTISTAAGRLFVPPVSAFGDVESFRDDKTVSSALLFEESAVVSPELLSSVTPIEVITTAGGIQFDYSYIPFGTDAFVVDPSVSSNRRIPPSSSLDPYPTNSEPITMDSRFDDVFNQTAVAKGTANGFELGLFLQDSVLDGSMMEAYARASTGYAVTGSQTDFIRASFTLDGLAAVAGLGEAYIQLDIANGDGEPLAFFNIVFDGRSDHPTVSFLQEGCQPNCQDDPQPFVQGGWSGSQTIDFFIPASDGVIDAILYGFASNGTGETATLNFLNTASLSIHPTGDTVVTLAAGQSFTAIPEPTTHALALAALCLAMGRRHSR